MPRVCARARANHTRHATCVGGQSKDARLKCTFKVLSHTHATMPATTPLYLAVHVPDLTPQRIDPFAHPFQPLQPLRLALHLGLAMCVRSQAWAPLSSRARGRPFGLVPSIVAVL